MSDPAAPIGDVERRDGEEGGEGQGEHGERSGDVSAEQPLNGEGADRHGDDSAQAVLEASGEVDPHGPSCAAEAERPRGDDGTGHVESSKTGLLPSPMRIDIPPPAAIDAVASSHGPESPTTSLIASLRSQLTLLSDQSAALNTKLIEAIDRHSNLEDTHLTLQQSHTELNERANRLAAEKAQWEESMNTGLLVERSQIKDEMQRLAAGLVEEERRRGSAEVRRQKVEEEVDELAASLFDQANTMVAAERMARTQAETRLKDTEENLAAAESAMRDMQLHLQSLAAPPQPPHAASSVIPRRYLSSHLPFAEFLSFLAHLRSLRPLKETSKAMFPPPAITTLLAQPFIARAITEDHDPTIRLDAAPDLSYFSRRNVGPAIIAGELFIEPVSAHTVLSATTAPPHDINCSLCGKPVFPQTVPASPAVSSFGVPPLHPAQKQSRFSLKPFFNTTASPSSNAHSPSQSPLASPSPAASAAGLSLPPVYVFRVNRPANGSAGMNEKDAKLYPLCRTGWCLERLRAACELWHFVRTGVIHVVWHGDDGHLLLAEQAREQGDATPTQADRRVSSSSIAMSEKSASDPTPPALPERKKSGGWGLGFKLSSNERQSGSPGGWFGRSASATPPRSPVTPGTPIPGDDEGESAKPAALDPPIELQPPSEEKDNAEKEGEVSGDVPVINRVEASPAVEAEDASSGGGTVPVESASAEEGLEPVIARNGSQRSLASSGAATDEAAFATPKGAHDGLPEEGEEEGGEDKPDGAEEPVEVKNEEDRQGEKLEDNKQEDDQKDEQENEQEDKQEDKQGEGPEDKQEEGQEGKQDDESRLEEQPAEDKAAQEASVKDEAREAVGSEDEKEGEGEKEEAGPDATSSEGIAPAGPVVDLTDPPAQPAQSGPPPIPRRAAHRISAKPPARDPAHTGDTAERSEGDIPESKEPSAEARSGTAETSLKSPPPLPPRHPRTPKAPAPAPGQPRDAVVDGEKRWMSEESEAWEEKTWRMIVKLKEGMWKARVGVTDDQEA